MKVVSRVQLPKTVETSELYINLDKSSSVEFIAKDRQISFSEGSTLSFNTYFNSIYENFYTKYTTLSSLYYLLKLEGDFEVTAYRERSEASQREVISHQKILQCQLSEYVKVDLPQLKQNQESGRIYLETMCLSQQGLFAEGLVVTEQEKQRDVSLGIISCTFKKEAYIRKTVDTILQDSFLQDKDFKIFVVDNGRTLIKSDFEDDKIQLISNRNVGGSGGFTRGLIEALQEGVCTHFLFMDDDIELDSEAIYRLFSLYEYAKQDFAVAGTMLDLYKKHILYEAGGLYNKYYDDEGNLQEHQLTVRPLKHNLDLRNPTSLNSLLLEDNIDYGGFWFFAFSKEVVENIGLLLPFFIKIDDMEFGLRIKQYLNIVAFPSLAVWHEPFYAKKLGWDTYYYSRNMLITNAMHSSLKYLNVVKLFTQNIIFYLLIFDYNTAKTYVKAFDDYMKGPSLLKNHDSEIMHSRICEYSRSHKSQIRLVKSVDNSEDYQITKAGNIQKVLSLLTLNGHFLPKFFIQDESTILKFNLQEQDSICKAFAKKRVIFILEEELTYSYQNELDNEAGIKILFSWIKSVITSTLKWSNVSAEWKKAAKDLASLEFWQNYLQPSGHTRSKHPNYAKSGDAA